MFTINIYVKFALIALFLGGGIILAFTQGFWYALIFLIIGLGLLASYLLLGTIQSAAEMIQVMDLDGAEKRLGLTFFPKLLYVSNRAFYYIIKGTIAINRNNTSLAEGYFNQALELKLPTDTEKGMVLLQLANINAQKNKWPAAQNYYREAKKLNITEPQMKNQLEEFGKALKNRGQAKAAQGMGRRGRQMMQPGRSKRRRPKMR
jgi:tetratricopeptide (TPR) repeat protein